MAKRGNGEGTIYYSEKLNKWVGQFTAGRKADGKINRKSVYGNTRKEVKEKMTKALSEVQENIFVEKNKTTLIELIDTYIEQIFKSNLIKDVSYKRNLDTRKIISSMDIANVSIQNINIIDINNSLLSVIDYSNSIISKIYSLLNNAFNLAMLNKVIYSNPFSIKGAIIKPKSNKETKKIEAFTVEEQNTFLEYLKTYDDKYKNILYIAIFTGMRIGEILVLKKEDIDLNNRKILINKTLTKDKDDKIILGKSTKTYSGMREIPFFEILYPLLSNYTNNGFLFLNNENFINPGTINIHFKKICKNADIQVISVKKKKNNSFVNLKTSNVNTHMLRHTFATRCIESRMSAIVLQKLLGHKDIKTTLNTYTSVFNKFKKDELLRTEKYFNEISNKTIF